MLNKFIAEKEQTNELDSEIMYQHRIRLQKYFSVMKPLLIPTLAKEIKRLEEQNNELDGEIMYLHRIRLQKYFCVVKPILIPTIAKENKRLVHL